MTAPTPSSVARIRAFHAEHGQAWGIIEESGMTRERHTVALFARQGDALGHMTTHYDPDEIEAMSVAIAHWDPEGEFWSYDH